MQAKIEEMKKELKKFTDERATVKKNLETFDELDFVVFSNQEWTRLHESHSKDVKVNWPDGHYTMGIEKHIEDLKAMFVYAPDTSIKVHPVKFGSGEYTSVIGVMTGTFTKPMPIGDGKVHSAHGQEVLHQYVYRGALERRRYDRRMAVLGQCDVHEADWNRKLERP